MWLRDQRMGKRRKESCYSKLLIYVCPRILQLSCPTYKSTPTSFFKVYCWLSTNDSQGGDRARTKASFCPSPDLTQCLQILPPCSAAFPEEEACQVGICFVVTLSKPIIKFFKKKLKRSSVRNHMLKEFLGLKRVGQPQIKMKVFQQECREEQLRRLPNSG